MKTQLAFEMKQELIAKEAIARFLEQELLPVHGGRKTPDPAENLLDSGILDSLGIMKLLEYLERTFAIKIREEDLLPEHFESINSIAFLVQRYQGNAGELHD